jgi:hypothetical protein
MFACLGGAGYWPLTAKVGLFRAPLDRVVRSARPWRSRRGSSWTTTRHPDLDTALAAHQPYPFGVEHAVFAVAAADGAWTVTVDSAFPSGDVAGFMRARALFDVECEFAAVAWVPSAADVLAASTFVHFLPERRFLRSPQPPGNTRWIQASDQDSRWEFDASGPARPFEEPQRYTARRKADRLTLDQLERYLAGVGVPVDDPGWLTGPAVAAVRPPPRPPESTWSTMVELRALCGYPADTVPTDLVRWR